MTLCLSAQDVCKSFSGTVTLQRASLHVHQGEILALLGPNGAGKTTFIKIMATLLRKDSGKVSICGYDLDANEDTVRHLFGYVGQDTERSAYARLTVVENLRFFGALRGLRQHQIDEQIEKLATCFDFHAHLNKLFTHLSGGQKQIVVIMRALLHDPPLLYLDEPTKGLDPIVARKIRAFLKQHIKREGRSLLLTSHILSEVDELADRVALIHDGAISVTGTPSILKEAVGASEFIEIWRKDLPQQTQTKLTHLEPVLFTLERDPDWIAFGVDDLLHGIEEIARVLRDDGINTRFRHHTTSLEDAFLHHVGSTTERFEQ